MATLPLLQRRAPRWRTPLLVVLGMLLASVLMFFVLPPGQRLLAGPARSAPVTGITQIQVLGDPQQNHVFAPAVVQVPVGTTLTWTFADTGASGGGEPVPHDVVFADERSSIQAIGSYQRTFTAPGNYSYVCSLHPFMEGRVEVVAP